MKCHGCGVEKDPAVKEVYPFPEDNIVTDRPIQPLHELDCEPTDDALPWKRVTVCHGCLHRLEPDMWISQQCWESLNPVVRFSELPDVSPEA